MMKRGIAAGLMLLLAGTAMAQNVQPEKKPARTPDAKTTDKQPADKTKSLSVGDKPPELMVKKWVKGEPVTGFEKGKVYVVEFWATWCGPCKVSIPHLTELQSKYKDKVTVVGVSVWERDDTAVEPFVKEWTNKMEYTVATDDMPALPEDVKNNTRDAQKFRVENGRMSQAWLKAAKRDGIPSAFIVNQEGTVAWIGNPLNGIDEPLEQVVAGTWDIKKAAAKYKAELDVAATMQTVQKALQSQDWDGALKAIDGAMGIDSDRDTMLASTKFQILLKGTKEYDKAYAFGREAVTKYFNNDHMALNQLAWLIIDPDAEPKIEKPDVDLAFKAATRAVELTKEKDAAILDTLALATFLKGDTKKALELQKKAVALAPDEMKAELEARLKQFEDANNNKK